MSIAQWRPCAGGALLALVVLASGCGADASPPPVPAAALRAPSDRGLPSTVSGCLALRDPATGVPAYASNGTRLPFDVHPGHEPGTAPRCGPGELRVMRLETLTVAGQLTYVRRGGCQTPCVERQATVHVPAAAFAGPIGLLPVAARRGDGAAVPGCDTIVHSAPQRVGRQLDRMFYKRPAETPGGVPAAADVGARWSNYGDPGIVYGGREGAPAADYTYLLWNLPRDARGVLHGGGIVRAVIARGQAVHLCPVASVTLPAFDVTGHTDGRVQFAYAEIDPAAGEVAYGWVLLSYTYAGTPTRRLTT